MFAGRRLGRSRRPENNVLYGLPLPKFFGKNMCGGGGGGGCVYLGPVQLNGGIQQMMLKSERYY